MTVVISMREALQGMHRIEQEIIDEVCARGMRVDASNFCWNYGRSRARLPLTYVHMEVRVGSKQTTAEWSRIVLQGSWERIDRIDVRQGIDHIVERLAGAQRGFCQPTSVLKPMRNERRYALVAHVAVRAGLLAAISRSDSP